MVAKSTVITRFVDRHKELALARKKFQTILTAELNFDFLVTLSGIPGIGKSTLLAKIKDEAEALNIQTIFIHCQPTTTAKDTTWSILVTIAEALFPNDAAWQEALQAYWDHEDQAAQVFYHDQLQNIFIEKLRGWLTDKPLVLLLDDTQFLEDAAHTLFEEILERVYDLNRLFVILAGRTNLRWRSFELRRRTHNIVLSGLEEDEAGKLLNQPFNPDLSRTVYQLTRGYPLASVRAYEWVAEHFTLTAPNISEQLQAQESELVFALVGSIFEDYILGHFDDLYTKSQLAWLLRYISPLRRFDDNLLYSILKEIEPTELESFMGLKVAALNTLVARAFTRQMVALTYLVKWDSAKIAYALDRPMRQLLSLEMKYKRPDRLLHINEFVKTWYQKAIKKAVEKDSSAPQSVVYLIEYIYHLIQYRQLTGETKNLQAEIRAEIQKRFAGYYLRERVHFLEEFSKDEDLAIALAQDFEALYTFVEKITEGETN